LDAFLLTPADLWSQLRVAKQSVKRPRGIDSGACTVQRIIPATVQTYPSRGALAFSSRLIRLDRRTGWQEWGLALLMLELEASQATSK
jgi:hypothetical protein